MTERQIERYVEKMANEASNREQRPVLGAAELDMLTRCDDGPRQSVRGAMLKQSDECVKRRHRNCASSHCNCSCHQQRSKSLKVGDVVFNENTKAVGDVLSFFSDDLVIVKSDNRVKKWQRDAA